MINLVMEHSQRGSVFALWAKYELLGQDEKLVEQYTIRKYVLVEGDVRHDRERAFKLAAALAVGVFLLTFAVLKRPMLAILLALIAFVLGWIGICVWRTRASAMLLRNQSMHAVGGWDGIDFTLSDRRNTKAARRFLAKG